MRYLLTGLVVCCTFLTVQAQNTFRATIQNNEGNPLPGATITWLEGKQSAAADSAGLVNITGIPSEMQNFSISHVGYTERTLSLTFPLTSDTTIVVTLEEEEEEHEEEVVVTATRSHLR
jgi:outer membrane receptor for ferrienterochelin and colicins